MIKKRKAIRRPLPSRFTSTGTQAGRGVKNEFLRVLVHGATVRGALLHVGANKVNLRGWIDRDPMFELQYEIVMHYLGRRGNER